MKESTKRTIRTAVQYALALALAAPLLITALGLPADVVAKFGAPVLAVALAVTKVWNVLEERSLVPSWLKNDPAAGA